MAVTRLDNIRPDMLRWAFRRAGYEEEKAIEAFPFCRKSYGIEIALSFLGE